MSDNTIIACRDVFVRVGGRKMLDVKKGDSIKATLPDRFTVSLSVFHQTGAETLLLVTRPHGEEILSYLIGGEQ